MSAPQLAPMLPPGFNPATEGLTEGTQFGHVSNIESVKSDPNFHALPMADQTSVLSHVDPNFAKLPEQDKSSVIQKFGEDFHANPQAYHGVQGFLNKLNTANQVMHQQIQNNPDLKTHFQQNPQSFPEYQQQYLQKYGITQSTPSSQIQDNSPAQLGKDLLGSAAAVGANAVKSATLGIGDFTKPVADISKQAGVSPEIYNDPYHAAQISGGAIGTGIAGGALIPKIGMAAAPVLGAIPNAVSALKGEQSPQQAVLQSATDTAAFFVPGAKTLIGNAGRQALAQGTAGAINSVGGNLMQGQPVNIGQALQSGGQQALMGAGFGAAFHKVASNNAPNIQQPPEAHPQQAPQPMAPAPVDHASERAYSQKLYDMMKSRNGDMVDKAKEVIGGHKKAAQIKYNSRGEVRQITDSEKSANHQAARRVLWHLQDIDYRARETAQLDKLRQQADKTAVAQAKRDVLKGENTQDREQAKAKRQEAIDARKLAKEKEKRVIEIEKQIKASNKAGDQILQAVFESTGIKEKTGTHHEYQVAGPDEYARMTKDAISAEKSANMKAKEYKAILDAEASGQKKLDAVFKTKITANYKEMLRMEARAKAEQAKIQNLKNAQAQASNKALNQAEGKARTAELKKLRGEIQENHRQARDASVEAGKLDASITRRERLLNENSANAKAVLSTHFDTERGLGSQHEIPSSHYTFDEIEESLSGYPDTTKAWAKTIDEAMRGDKQVNIEYAAERTGHTSTIPFKKVSPHGWGINPEGDVYFTASNEHGNTRRYYINNGEGDSRLLSEPQINDNPAFRGTQANVYHGPRIYDIDAVLNRPEGDPDLLHSHLDEILDNNQALRNYVKENPKAPVGVILDMADKLPTGVSKDAASQFLESLSEESADMTRDTVNMIDEYRKSASETDFEEFAKDLGC